MPRRQRGWKVRLEPAGKNFRIRWRGKYGTGQRVFVFKADAREFAQGKRSTFQRIDAGLALPEKPARYLTIGTYAGEYLEYSKKEKSARTHNNFDRPAVASLRKFFGDHTSLTDVRRSDFERCKLSLPQNTPSQRTTAAMTVSAGATFFNYARDLEYITKSPARGVKKPVAGPGGRALKETEIWALLDGAPEAIYRTGVFSLNTYLRIEEVSMFDWSWTFEIPRYGLFGRIPKEVRKNARSAEKDCVFPINDAARAVMGQARQSGRVFPWSPVTIQHQVTAQRRDKNLPEDVTFHCFRHTGATNYLRNGGHMEDLLEESGSGLWKDPRSLLKYIHVSPETLAPRFALVKYQVPAPSWPLNENGQGRRPGHGLPALPDSPSNNLDPARGGT